MSEKAFESTSDFDEAFVDWLADELVENDEMLLDALVQYRQKQGIDIETVAVRMGVAPQQAADMETHYADPPLSLLRRYALAIGVHVNHTTNFARSLYSAIVAEVTEPTVCHTEYVAVGANLNGVYQAQFSFPDSEVDLLSINRKKTQAHWNNLTIEPEMSSLAHI